METAALAGGAGMSTAIAWIEGQWGTAASLQLPLDDRALLLACLLYTSDAADE